jgi:hypothetical protein
MQWLLTFIGGIFVGQEYTSIPRIKTIVSGVIEYFSKKQEAEQEFIWYNYLYEKMKSK